MSQKLNQMLGWHNANLEQVNYLTKAEIDCKMALLLLEASIQAYRAFDSSHPAIADLTRVTIPEGYELIDSWTGVDALFNRLQHVETYGLVFRSEREPYTYIFAFRGTDTWQDFCDDCGFDRVRFSPYNRDVIVPDEVRVEYGFNHIYTDAYGETQPMQQQLFALVDKYLASAKPIDRLYVTGHSLGCTLATLFALDLALARPEISVINYNYASPRVGNQAFVDFYQQHSLGQRTVRFQNIFDKIPHTPLEIQEYRHLPNAYLIAFYRDRFGGKLDIMSNHSSLNYQKVLKHILQSPNVNYEMIFTGNHSQKMKSVNPNSITIANCSDLNCDK